MNVRSLLTIKTIRFVVIGVVLGAVGSGAWEWVLKPLLLSATDFGLNVATLGVHSFKNSLYKDIARGLHEESSLRLYIAVFSLLPATFLGVSTGFLLARRMSTTGMDATLDRAIRVVVKPFFVFLIVLLVFSIVQANQLAYVNRAITHVDQLFEITDPYVRDDERMMYRSQFAQVSSSEDYAKLTTSLEQICRAKNLRVPEFSVW